MKDFEKVEEYDRLIAVERPAAEARATSASPDCDLVAFALGANDK
jgi:hypothetical protein